MLNTARRCASRNPRTVEESGLNLKATFIDLIIAFKAFYKGVYQLKLGSCFTLFQRVESLHPGGDLKS